MKVELIFTEVYFHSFSVSVHPGFSGVGTMFSTAMFAKVKAYSPGTLFQPRETKVGRGGSSI